MLILLVLFILSSIVTLAILVVDRIQHPPTNGHYREVERVFDDPK